MSHIEVHFPDGRVERFEFITDSMTIGRGREADICIAPLGLNDRNVTQGACPIKVLEYMASSRPLVASNMPIVRELVREDIDALLFSPNDPDDLARQILTLLKDVELSKRLSDSATERALTKFTWHAAQKKLLKVYRKLLT